MVILGLTTDQANLVINVLEDWTLMTDGNPEIDTIINYLKERIEE